MDMAYTELVAPGYYASMGPGVPAGFGIQAASGRRPLVLVGDVAFQMTGWELGNARQYSWTPIVLVFNNAAWEMLRAFQPETHYNSLYTWDFAGHSGSLRSSAGRACACTHVLNSRLHLRKLMQTRVGSGWLRSCSRHVLSRPRCCASQPR
eukprot:82182-Rhodomonas_salina.1